MAKICHPRLLKYQRKKVVFELTQRLEADWAKGKQVVCYIVKSSNKKSAINWAY